MVGSSCRQVNSKLTHSTFRIATDAEANSRFHTFYKSYNSFPRPIRKYELNGIVHLQKKMFSCLALLMKDSASQKYSSLEFLSPFKNPYTPSAQTNVILFYFPNGSLPQKSVRLSSFSYRLDTGFWKSRDSAMATPTTSNGSITGS
jgi:hypothetical protein